jgi:hypothetical protein
METHNKQGKLTKYGLSCGYFEREKTGNKDFNSSILFAATKIIFKYIKTNKMKFIILNQNCAAYQQGVACKSHKDATFLDCKTPSHFIFDKRYWCYATKFNTIDEAIERIKSEGKIKKYRVVSFENPTKIFAENGIKKEFSQLLTF